MNGFFISRLVSSIDSGGDKIEMQAERIARVETRIDSIDKKLDYLMYHQEKQSLYEDEKYRSRFYHVRVE